MFNPLLKVRDCGVSLRSLFSQEWMQSQQERETVPITREVPHLKWFVAARGRRSDCPAESLLVAVEDFEVRSRHGAYDSVCLAATSSAHANASFSIKVASEVFDRRFAH